MIRRAKFAGSFYPASDFEIEEFIESNLVKIEEKYNAISVMVPHAGYIFSGKTAIKVYSSIVIPDSIVIIGPNHTGIGAQLSIMTEGLWETPLGNAYIDSELANNILSNSKYLQADDSAHMNEHSIEVQIPLLLYFNNNFKFVPIIMSNYSLAAINDIAFALSKVCSKNTLVIASSDMSHYVPRNVAKELDFIAFEKILNLDAEGLMKVVYDYNISMCGSGPMSISIKYSIQKGAKYAKLIDYTDSGVITNDTFSVVSYAGFVIT